MSFRTSTIPPEAHTPAYSFPRPKRLTRGPDIRQVQLEGKRARTASMELRAVVSLQAFPRVGVIVPRYKHSAVERNQLKRRLREIVRVAVLPQLAPVDVVIRVSPGAYQRDFHALQEDLAKLVRQLGSVLTRAFPSEPLPSPEP